MQVDLEADSPRTDQAHMQFFTENHLYGPLPIKRGRYHRTRFFYGKILQQYTKELKQAYEIAEKRWGRPDMLHAHVSLPAGYGASQLAIEKGVPVIVTEHYTGFESDARFWWRVGCYIKEMGCRIQGFYAVSPGYAERIRRTGLVNVSGVLPNPIDTEIFRPSGKDKTPTGSFQMITAGGLSFRKGIDVLFNALKGLSLQRAWQLTVFGNTQNRKGFEKWLDDPQLKDRIRLEGKVPQKRIIEAYSTADLYIVSSRVETANVAMLEALSCGVPVLTTRCGAPETLIDDSVGMAVESENPAQMADAIETIARGGQKFDRQHLRQFVLARYSIPAVGQKIASAYTDAMNRKPLRS